MIIIHLNYYTNGIGMFTILINKEVRWMMWEINDLQLQLYELQYCGYNAILLHLFDCARPVPAKAMFVLSVLEESIRVEPKDLARPRLAAVSSVVESLLVNKVVQGLGLVISLYDVQHIESGFVHHSDGGVRFLVRFRVVVFRPFPGEVLIAKPKKATK